MREIYLNQKLYTASIYFNQHEHNRYNFYDIEVSEYICDVKTIYRTLSTKPFYNSSKLANKLYKYNAAWRIYYVNVYRKNAIFQFCIKFI